MNTKRIVEVAGNQALLREERYGGYRADLVRCLVDVIAAQSEGRSEKGRREKVANLVSALGSRVGARGQVS